MDGIRNNISRPELARIHRIPLWADKCRDKIIWPYGISREATVKSVYGNCDIHPINGTSNNLVIPLNHLNLWQQIRHMECVGQQSLSARKK